MSHAKRMSEAGKWVGKFTTEELAFLIENYAVMTLDEMEIQMKRDRRTIAREIQKIRREGKTAAGQPLIMDDSDLNDLKNRHFWQTLKKEFPDADDQQTMRTMWIEIQKQFFFDMLPTEEQQLVDLLRMEILASHALREEQNLTDEIKTHEKDVRALTKKMGAELDPDEQFKLAGQIADLDNLIATKKAVRESSYKKFLEFIKSKDVYRKALKGSRADRIDKIEKSQDTFLSMLKNIIGNPEVAHRVGVAMERNRLAMMAEKERLGKFHTYNDGSVDIPFFTPEIAKKLMDNE